MWHKAFLHMELFCSRSYFKSASCLFEKTVKSSGQSYQYHLLSASSLVCIPDLDLQFIVLNPAIIAGSR